MLIAYSPGIGRNHHAVSVEVFTLVQFIMFIISLYATEPTAILYLASKYSCIGAPKVGGGGLQPSNPPPSKRNLKYTGFRDLMSSRFYMIYAST